MPATPPGFRDPTHYDLRPRTPTRAWITAGIALLAGVIAFVVGWSEPRNTVLVVSGAVLALGGAALGITTAVFMRTRTLRITLSPDGYEVFGPGYHKSGAWIDVDAVSATPDGTRLVIARGRVDRTFIQPPRGEAEEQMRAIVDDITDRLQALGR